jgi:hypothetical protein
MYLARRDLAQLTLKYPGLAAEWLLQTGRFTLYNKAQRLQRECDTEELERRSSSRCGDRIRVEGNPRMGFQTVIIPVHLAGRCASKQRRERCVEACKQQLEVFSRVTWFL